MAPEQASDGSPTLTPLKFLVGVMKDSEGTPKQRIRAARIAARYKHAHLQPDKLAPLDEYGFSISRTLAKAISDDWQQLEYLESGRMGAKSADHVQEASRIYVRQAERDQFLRCPPGYSAEQDLKRRSELLAKSYKGWKALSMAEETELAHVIARITASEAAFNRTPEGRARRRVKELRARISMRAAGRAKPLRGLTTEEDSELERLHRGFPALGPYKPYVPIEELIKQWAEERAESPRD